MTAMTMQVLDTDTLPIKRQIKAKKQEIDGYQRLIRQRVEWLARPESKNSASFRGVVESRAQLNQKLEEAKYDLYRLEQLNNN
jgi:hypothetical protein